MSNLKQMGLGAMMYSQDYDGKLPRLATCGPTELETGKITTNTSACDPPSTGYVHLWMHSIYPYVKSVQVFNCPSVDDDYTGSYYRGAYLSYGYNRTPFDWSGGSDVSISLASIYRPSQSIMFADSKTTEENGGTSILSYVVNHSTAMDRHLETVNVAYFDGHVKSQKKSNITYSVTACSDPAWAAWTAVKCP